MNHSKAKYSEGFTLIEVLVSLVVFSSVVAVVVMGLEQGQKQWLRSLSKNQEMHQLYLRSQWINQAISQANSAPFIVEYGFSTPYFLGTSNQVDFLTNAPVLSGPGTYAAARFSIEETAEGLSLTFTQWANKDPYYGIPTLESQGKSISLLENIQDAKWEYYLDARTEATPMEIKYNAFSPRHEGRWASQYDSRYEQKIPSKIRFTFQKEGKRYDWYFNLTPFTSAAGQEEPLVTL
ncbi:prepilin-type N-terminal cleavage/methylation domain-containing protein [Vibrio rotiferianus]|uniref:prepilin-type N-terminal cleavage/methylation domain-containing protein n=1 Tax=Vibrio rotiferianus TaxID=190895 RepID=UPI0002376712|nr:prepilin-type N-terminal cleavage/methylation domain-containing protein [Vibrio rotiferianus]